MLELFDPLFLRKLEVLQINSRRASMRGLRGEILTSKKGSSLEFMEYKEYCFGDDFKHIDWNIYGRLEKLYVRTFRGEKNLMLYIFFDASRSMSLPRKDKKYEFTLKTVAALSYVGLLSHNSLKLIALSGKSAGKLLGNDNPLVKESPFFYNCNDIFKVARFLHAIEPDGEADMREGIKKVIAKNRGMGTAIIISDFWMESTAYRQAITFLCGKNFDINVIHIQGEEECYPALKIGRLKIEDVENAEQKTVTLNEHNRRQYVDAVSRHQSELQKLCLRNRANYVSADTAHRVEDFILKELPKMRLLR
ncbi:MAG: DUF58 domain-containing protein [Candidatus Schekmanbacteria bacterium]|nr:DUF58 domain-containing protein [Candidatus Schekmanbacteria bacterium]